MKHEVTVTLRPMIYSKTAQDQFNMTALYIKSIFLGRKSSIIAELTQEHNIHYHCLVEIDGMEDKDKFLNRFRQYNKIFGRKSCRAVQFEESYEEYMIKDYHKTAKVISDPFVQDDFNLINTIPNITLSKFIFD